MIITDVRTPLQTFVERERDRHPPKAEFTFIDLFAGIGGTRIAFEIAGGRCVFSCEWDKFACQTYEANFGESPQGDVTQIDPEAIEDFDVLVGVT
jgi:DNA (cytosine-5)-methyltransferase 1